MKAALVLSELLKGLRTQKTPPKTMKNQATYKNLRQQNLTSTSNTCLKSMSQTFKRSYLDLQTAKITGVCNLRVLA